MTAVTNILQQVQTYQKSSLGYLQNLNCFIGDIANTKFKNFQDIPTNLGSSVTFDLPPRFVTSAGLVANFQGANQRVATLSCTQSANTPFAFTAQERIFNVEKDTWDYMKTFGMSAVQELASYVEIDVAKQATSSVQIMNPDGTPTGNFQSDSGPFRFFGDGVTAINSFGQLAQMIANFKNFGSVKEGIKVVLPDLIIPTIVNSGLNQFAMKRNDDIANSWEVGEFGTPPVRYCISNLLPIHYAGTVGDNATPGGNVLTVISTNDLTGNNITQITCSGAPTSDPNAIKYSDMGQFNDGVSGLPNLRFLTFIGHARSGQKVQFRVTADAGSDGSGHVVLNIYPPLQSTFGANQNITSNIVAGMQLTIAPSHRAGLVSGGSAFYLAMPRLPDQAPFATAAEYDENTQVSIRLTTGSTFGQNNTGSIYDCIWGSMAVPEYHMRILFPLSQG